MLCIKKIACNNDRQILMHNTITSISFSIFSNKGIYALLLGSGISKNAGIPTGWDVIQDLIRKLAVLNKEPCEPTPQKWFEQKYGIEVNYSTILAKLAKTPDERLNLLKPYFESTEGKLPPSKAHVFIAKLIKSGYFKVVITTNFDRLLENALINEGVEPTVIKHYEDIKGASPIVHNKFTLIKINGDYLDSRFLNTEDELSVYNDELRKYILNIINEFGIISCGWSAKWDSGLIRIFRESENFRFSSYWSYCGVCETELTEIALFRKGETIKIENADNFFEQISENISALEKLNDNHPLNADIAVARIKKYIVKDEYRIQFHDLFLQQIEIVSNKLQELHKLYRFSEKEDLIALLFSYQNSLTILIPMLVNSVYWASVNHYYIFKEVLLRLFIPLSVGAACIQGTENFRQFPALIAFYTIGIMAVYTEKHALLKLCFELKVDEDITEYSEQIYFIQNAHACDGVVDNSVMNGIILNKQYKTPVSTYLHQILRPHFKVIIPSSKDYEKAFDIFEYLISLNYSFLCSSTVFEWAPWGEYKWRRRNKNDTIKDFDTAADMQQDSWPPIKSGMFGGTYQTYLKARKKLYAFLNQVRI